MLYAKWSASNIAVAEKRQDIHLPTKSARIGMDNSTTTNQSLLMMDMYDSETN